jgi:hypothetical protein
VPSPSIGPAYSAGSGCGGRECRLAGRLCLGQRIKCDECRVAVRCTEYRDGERYLRPLMSSRNRSPWRKDSRLVAGLGPAEDGHGWAAVNPAVALPKSEEAVLVRGHVSGPAPTLSAMRAATFQPVDRVDPIVGAWRGGGRLVGGRGHSVSGVRGGRRFGRIRTAARCRVRPRSRRGRWRRVGRAAARPATGPGVALDAAGRRPIVLVLVVRLLRQDRWHICPDGRQIRAAHQGLEPAANSRAHVVRATA